MTDFFLLAEYLHINTTINNKILWNKLNKQGERFYTEKVPNINEIRQKHMVKYSVCFWNLMLLNSPSYPELVCRVHTKSLSESKWPFSGYRKKQFTIEMKLLKTTNSQINLEKEQGGDNHIS